MKSLSRLGLLVGVLVLPACTASSATFVGDRVGYSVTKGRITSVDNLHSNKLEALSDGVAFTVSQPGCVISMLFDDDQSTVFELGSGVIIVHGPDSDYILQSEVQGERD